MKQYKVLCLAVGGRGKKIHRFGDIVKETNFMDGRADELVISGHLGLIEGSEEPVKESELVDQTNPGGDQTNDQEKNNDASQSPDPGEGQPTQEPKEEPVKESEKPKDESADETQDDINEVGIKELRKQLKEAGISFSNNESKESLYKKLLNA